MSPGSPGDLSKVRNIGIVAHIDAGKTTVSERILYYCGVEHRMGEVHEGTAVMDWMEEERKRGITITAAATSVAWRGVRINLVDTPGHVDFTVEVERCMRVLDGAVLVLSGVAGLQAQSETVWRQMKHNGVPYIAFVNQYDRPGADFFACVADLQDKLGEPAVPIQYPMGTEREFRTIVDLVERRALTFREDDLGAHPVEIEVPPEVAEEVDVLRAELVERIAEEDEEVLACVLEDRAPTPDLIRRGLRRCALAGTVVPVLVGAALRNVGIQPLLDAVCDYLPSPLDLPPVRGHVPVKDKDAKNGTTLEAREETRPPEPAAPLAALAFKIAADRNEDLTFVRVYSGTIEPGQKVFHPRIGRMERVARVLRMHADDRRPVDRAGPGEIVALSGLKAVGTGDTLCDRAAPIVLERLEFPEPVMTLVVEPHSTTARDKLAAALRQLAREDPTLEVREDEDTGQWLVAGMGELHLEVMQHRLERDFRVPVRVGKPRVAYREAVREAGRAEARVDRTLGGKEVFGELELEILPDASEASSGAPRVEWAEGAIVSRDLRSTVEEALLLGAMVGPRFGFPLVGARIRVLRVATHAGKDAEVGLALRQALSAARVDLLEPVMSFEITAPAEFMSGIIAELNASRANIAEHGVEGDQRTVRGRVPLFRMFGYSTTLRSLSQGRASFSLEPRGFAPVPEGELAARGLVWE
jgi:elongation factor G